MLLGAAEGLLAAGASLKLRLSQTVRISSFDFRGGVGAKALRVVMDLSAGAKILVSVSDSLEAP